MFWCSKYFYFLLAKNAHDFFQCSSNQGSSWNRVGWKSCYSQCSRLERIFISLWSKWLRIKPSFFHFEPYSQDSKILQVGSTLKLFCFDSCRYFYFTFASYPSSWCVFEVCWSSDNLLSKSIHSASYWHSQWNWH